MDKLYKVKSGAIIKVVPEGSLKWYIMAGWKVLKEKKKSGKSKANSKKSTSK